MLQDPLFYLVLTTAFLTNVKRYLVFKIVDLKYLLKKNFFDRFNFLYKCFHIFAPYKNNKNKLNFNF